MMTVVYQCLILQNIQEVVLLETKFLIMLHQTILLVCQEFQQQRAQL